MKNIMQRYRHPVNLLLTLALFLNAIAPLSFALAHNADQNSGIEELFGNKILICTPLGYKYISLDEFKNGAAPEDHDTRPHCPLCVINMAADHPYIPTDFVIEYPHITPIKPHYHGVSQNFTLNEIYTNANPRAPPHFS